MMAFAACKFIVYDVHGERQCLQKAGAAAARKTISNDICKETASSTVMRCDYDV